MWDLVFAQQTPQTPSEPEAFVSFIPLIILLIIWYLYSRFTRKRTEERLRSIISEELHKVIDELQSIGRTK